LLVFSGEDSGSSFGSTAFFPGFGFVENDSFDCCFAASPFGFPKNFL
jgi:hypothetical protein